MKTTEPEITQANVEQLIKQLEPIANAMEREFSAGVAIYGAGFVGTWALRYLRSLDAHVNCFIDGDPAKVGASIDSIPIVSPVDPIVAAQASIFISARHAVGPITAAMKRDALHLLSFDSYFVIKNSSRLYNIRDKYLEDERSIKVFNAILLAMLTGSTASCRAVMEKDMYFSLPEFSGNFEEAFVDAGAFVGDTVERFIWENLGTFRHIYAFEPGQKQFAALEKRMQRLTEEWAFPPDSLTLVKGGLAAEEGEMTCSFVEDFPLRHGLTDCLDANSQRSYQAKVHTLDTFLGESSVTFIKADVEGMELALLKGARATIQRWRPKMAICIYHYPSDLFEIAEYIRSIIPEYRFSLRQHAPIFGDFVLYCYT